MIIETVPRGTNLTAYLNGKSLGIVESNPEHAFAYWGERARLGAYRARQAGESRPRVYTLRSDKGVTYVHSNGQWRAA